MPTPTKGPRLGGGPAHERLLLANLATSLFEHGRITTTEAKAKRLRPLAERLITKAKRGDLHARRHVMRTIRDKGVAHALFETIGPRYENRPGGYTRITKIGPRKGDNAPMAVIELVEALTVQQSAVREAEAATRRTARDRSGSTAATATPVAAATPVAVDAGDTGAPDAGQGARAGTADDVEVVSAQDDTAADTGEDLGDVTAVESDQVSGITGGDGDVADSEPATAPDPDADKT